ncbi:MAG: DUF4298 domain-containing protein [Enterococcus sp.]|jgi:hypothetical protein|nr:DUF4298 domain-containing protein [Enterococcus sp.]
MENDKNYDHITKYENILNQFNQKIQELAELLLFFEEHSDEFVSLMDYYHSNQRQEDLEAENRREIPADLPRGVLSEDAIYNLYTDYREVSLKMLANGTRFFKEN